MGVVIELLDQRPIHAPRERAKRALISVSVSSWPSLSSVMSAGNRS